MEGCDNRLLFLPWVNVTLALVFTHGPPLYYYSVLDQAATGSDGPAAAGRSARPGRRIPCTQQSQARADSDN